MFRETIRALWMVAAAVATAQAWGEPQTPVPVGKASFDSSRTQGCGELPVDSDDPYAAIVDSTILRLVSPCGAWIELGQPQGAAPDRPTIRVRVVGVKGSSVARIDLLPKAWDAWAGAATTGPVAMVPWRFVDSPVDSGGIVVTLGKGSINQFQILLRVSNTRTPVSGVMISSVNRQLYFFMNRVGENQWLWQGGAVGSMSSPFLIRLFGANEELLETLEDTVRVALVESASARLSVQFSSSPTTSVGRIPGEPPAVRRSSSWRDAQGRLRDRRSERTGSPKVLLAPSKVRNGPGTAQEDNAASEP